MSTGNYNGKKIGGQHTGKKQKRFNSICYVIKRQPNHKFKPGVEVYNIKSGERGMLIEKKIKTSRSVVLFKTETNCYYIRTELLRTVDTLLNNKHSNKCKKKQNKKSRYNDETIKQNKLENKKRIFEFKQKKKLINDILRKYKTDENILMQHGSTQNLSHWFSNKQDFYDFIKNNDENSIDKLIKSEKIQKKYLIENISETYIKNILNKKENVLDIDTLKILLEDKKNKYKKELSHKNIYELKQLGTFNKQDFLNYEKEYEKRKNIEHEYEVI
tara:strand:+ start:554 stop:1372 length:819 start_codon:yes stop_codon:yes gene_type:complete